MKGLGGRVNAMQTTNEEQEVNREDWEKARFHESVFLLVCDNWRNWCAIRTPVLDGLIIICRKHVHVRTNLETFCLFYCYSSPECCTL